jgi:hypothetical protein
MSESADLFETHLTETFGEGAAKFSEVLRGRLRKLWSLAQEKPKDSTPLSWAAPGVVSARVTHSKCTDCNGTGIGDYPWECHRCGGDGSIQHSD